MQIYTGKIQWFQVESTGMEILCDGEWFAYANFASGSSWLYKFAVLTKQ